MSRALVDRPSSAASSVLDLAGSQTPLLYSDDAAHSFRSLASHASAQPFIPQTTTQEVTIVAEPEQASHPVDKPTEADIHEIIGLLKVTS